ncbi:Sec-independent protein translocase protein TatB [Mycobacterium tuberculosis]
MFANIGWGEMLVLVMVGLVVLGPERLPGAIRWAASALRQARDHSQRCDQPAYVEDIGPGPIDLRGHLAAAGYGEHPRAALTKHLLDGERDSLFTGDFDRLDAEETGCGGSAGPDATEQIGAGPSRLTAMPPDR